MGTSTENRPRRQLFLVLSAIAAVTLTVIAVLTFWPRPTVVELELSMSRIELTVVPPARSQVGLLDPDIRLQKLDLREVDSLHAILEGQGSAVLRPLSGGSIRLDAGLPLETELRLFRPTRVAVMPSGRDRHTGGAVVKLTLEETGLDGWSGAVQPEPDLRLELRDVEVRQEGSDATTVDRGTAAVGEDSAVLELHGGSRPSEIGLFLPPRRAATTLLRVVDLATGEEAPPRSLSFASAEPRSLAWADRLVLLEPQPAESGSDVLLHPNLKALDLQLFRPDPVEPESYVLGGHIRFPGGERTTVDLEPGVLLALESREPLVLRSLALAGGRLEMVVRGKAARLEVGPTPDLRTELLPNLFQWLYTHELRRLGYGILASVLGTSLALFKLFGLFKE